MCEPTELCGLRSMWIHAMCSSFMLNSICYVIFFLEIFSVGGVSCAMDTTAPDDLTGRADDVTDLDMLFDALSQAASNIASDLEEPVQEPSAEDTGYKGFRLRWKKRPLPEAEDVVPSPSLAPTSKIKYC